MTHTDNGHTHTAPRTPTDSGGDRRAPWWYHIAIGLAVLAFFVSLEMNAAIPVAVPLAVVLPGLLADSLRRRYGIRVNRRMTIPATRPYYIGAVFAVVALAVAGLLTDLTGALAAGGLVAAVVTVWASRRADLTAIAHDPRASTG